MESHEETRSSVADNEPTQSPIAAVFNFWKGFNLESERGKLYEQVLKIAENQEISQKNRKKLAESTRDFRKASNEEKQSLFDPLLKAFQEEVNNITKRAKFGENSFVTVYQKLDEAPDPCQALASASELSSKVSELESENRKMKHELEEFRAEAANLRNQQATVRRLEERNRQLELQMEEKVKEIVEIKQRTLAEENQKTLEVLKEREMLLQDQLRAAKDSVTTMQRLHEYGQSQLFEYRAKSEEERAAKQSELNLLTDEVERAQSRLLSLEREKDQLRNQLQTVHTPESEIKEREDLNTNVSLEASLSAKEKVISDLHAELLKLETTLSKEREQHLSDIKKLNAVISEKEAMIDKIQKELQERPTSKQVEDLKKQIKILQAVGYNFIETDDWEAPSSGENMTQLELLLLDKNRKVEHELTQLKIKLSEREVTAEASEAKVKELTVKIDEQTQLISKLEEDILKGYSSVDRRSSKADDWDLPELGISEILEKTDRSKSQADDDQTSILQVICNQRDRFRQRLKETEEELRQSRDKNKALAAELERCKEDNVKLYEKIRYIQDYSKDWPISRGQKKRVEDLESGFGSDIETKYKKIYEDDINPFTAFSKKEKERRYKELGIRDRITLTSGRFLLGNKYARTFVFFYSIALHLLVFTSLYRMSALSYNSVAKGSIEVEKSAAKMLNITIPHSD